MEDLEGEKEDHESYVSKLVGVWSSFAVTTIIMFWIFPTSWIKWVVIISVGAGAVKKTLSYVEQQKRSQPLQSHKQAPVRSLTSSSTAAQESESTPEVRYCPQCGTLLPLELSRCSTCGYDI